MVHRFLLLLVLALLTILHFMVIKWFSSEVKVAPSFIG